MNLGSQSLLDSWIQIQAEVVPNIISWNALLDSFVKGDGNATRCLNVPWLGLGRWVAAMRVARVLVAQCRVVQVTHLLSKIFCGLVLIFLLNSHSLAIQFPFLWLSPVKAPPGGDGPTEDGAATWS